MLLNYLLTAVRNFRNNKIYSLINILGLSIGITASLVIFMIVYFEFSFDTFQKDRDRLFRVVIDAKFNGSEGHSTGVPAPLAGAIEREVSGVAAVVPVVHFQGDSKVPVAIQSSNASNITIKKQPGIIFTNPAYFQILPYRWLAGNSKGVSTPFHVVLTSSRAKQYFPGKAWNDIVGSTITYNGDLNVKVAGIVDDLNQNTLFTAAEFISYSTIAKTGLQENFMMSVWNDWMAYSQLYVKLSPAVTEQQTESALQGLVNKYNKEVNRDAANSLRYTLQPLSEVHFDSRYQAVGDRPGHKPTLYGLIAIGAFLLILGCINFINLTTAQASKRAREIGIRKTMGGLRHHLVWQFLGETLILTLGASFLAILLLPSLLTIFSDFIPPGLSLSTFGQGTTILFFAVLIILVTFLSGAYPAFILSGLQPISVLKNQLVTNTSQTRSGLLRKSLTVSQFLIAQFFVIGTLMVSKQINYSLKADMGFNKEAIVNFDLPRDTITANHRKILSQIRSLPGVDLAGTGFLAPADAGVAYARVAAIINNKEIIPDVNVQLRWGNPEFIDVYKMKIIAGRNVQQSDTIREFLINETFARALGFTAPNEVLNHSLKWRNQQIPIVGVLKDFHDQSMHTAISAMMFGGQPGNTFHVKLKPSGEGSKSWQSTLATMDKIFHAVYRDEEFNYSFLDDKIANFYEREQNTARLLTWATGLAILISCIGLAGLVVYITNSRRKEIGIRKVLGASVLAIVKTLSRDFLVLVIIAFVIAVPLAWWAISAWLQNFVYRTPMSWWIFAVAGITMLLLAFLVVALQTIKAAMSNPVESLRTE